MSRPSTTVLLPALLLTLLLAACGNRVDEAPPNGTETAAAALAGGNLLLITIDTLRADHLGSYGDSRAHTPNLDALAAGGTRFANAYTPVPLTLPAHSVLFTGRHPFATGVRINGVHLLDDGERTLAERFRDAGYATGATISAYVLISRFGLAQGFDVYEDSLAMDDVYRFYAEIPADEAVRRFRRWLDQRSEERPFFAWLHLFDPHQPYAPPEPWAGRFPDDPYRGEIAFVDQQVGVLLDDLETRGLAADTAVVVTSDHGEGFGEHGEEGHGLLAYDETLRIPLIVHAPGTVAAGRVVEGRVSLYDLTPTLIELFALDGGEAVLPGRSLAPALTGGAAAPVEPATVYFETLAGREKGWAPITGVIDGDHKLIDVPLPELYDLAADPGERHNLVAGDRAGLAARRLSRRLRELTADAPEPGAGSRRVLSEEERRRLGALGYTAGAGGAGDGPGIDPKRAIVLENRLRHGRRLVEEGRPGDAAEVLARLRADHPEVELPDLYELEFEIARARGDEESAAAALRRGVRTFPDFASLELRLATYLQETGRLDEAERRAADLLRRDPRNTQAVTLLGLVARRRGDQGTARRRFEDALRLEPGSVPLRTLVAETALRTGDRQRARALYDELLAEGALDDQPDQLARSALLDAALGDLDRAEATLRRVIEIEPGGIHHLSLGMLLLQRGRTEQAAEQLDAALAAEARPLEPTQRRLAEATLRRLRGAG